MKKEASLPVRLDTDEKRRLKIAAGRMGLTVSALIRLLVRSFVEEYERQGGRVMLPPDWREMLGADIADASKVAEKPVTYKNTKQKKSARE
jgi:hypothetical protein